MHHGIEEHARQSLFILTQFIIPSGGHIREFALEPLPDTDRSTAFSKGFGRTERLNSAAAPGNADQSDWNVKTFSELFSGKISDCGKFPG